MSSRDWNFGWITCRTSNLSPLRGDLCLFVEIPGDTTRMVDRASLLCLKLRGKAVLFSGLRISQHLLLDQDLHKSICCCIQLNDKRIESQLCYKPIWLLCTLAIRVTVLSVVASKWNVFNLQRLYKNSNKDLCVMRKQTCHSLAKDSVHLGLSLWKIVQKHVLQHLGISHSSKTRILFKDCHFDVECKGLR